jgi:chlorophyll synthase
MAAGALPEPRVLVLAGLYSLGAHGIMTLNDFKAIEGDRRMGIGSLPVRLGVQRAGWAACLFMAVPQIAVIALLVTWGHPAHGAGVGALLAVQLALMSRFLRRPRERALWYSALGVNFFVLGMLVSAFALRAGSAA